MNQIKRLLAVVVATMTVLAASAQFHIGPRVGMQINDMKFSTDVLDSSNRTGLAAGLEIEFTVPLIGIGFDLSAMYCHRVTEGTSIDAAVNEVLSSSNFRSRDYIEVPLNLKYKLTIPAISSIIAPYLTTGPSFAFLTSKQEISNAFRNKTFDMSWNFGGGLQLIKHLQLGVNYSIGLGNTVEKIGLTNEEIESKHRGWTVTAAWLF